MKGRQTSVVTSKTGEIEGTKIRLFRFTPQAMQQETRLLIEIIRADCDFNCRGALRKVICDVAAIIPVSTFTLSF